MDATRAIAQAHQALAAGDLAGALRQAEAVIAAQPGQVQARQLAAVIARRLGRPAAARAHLEAALGAAPGDPHLLNSFANVLFELGDFAGARGAYERAVAADPRQPDPRVNLALACKRLGDHAAALGALEAALAFAPQHRRALQALADLKLTTGDLEGAASALDRALALAPDDVRLLASRAHVESELGGRAAALYGRARALAPHDRELALAEALALAHAGDGTAAEARLEALVAAHPDFADAHAALAHQRWQRGEAARFTESYERALAVRPGDAGLWLGLFGALMRAGRPQEVLDRLGAAAALGETRTALEAAAATEAGDTARADAAFARLDPAADAGLRLAYARHLLRAGRPDAAAAFALPLVETAGDEDLWPYLSTAWRLTGDARAHWLDEDPAFIRAIDLPLSPGELAALAEVLRALHHARAAPFDQTLRGGTQTDGGLLGRREPEIRRLRAALEGAVAEYIAGLPAPDPRHPLLRRPRDGFRFAGSWSVRLRDAGFHVNHVHTTGWISSACYIALPETLGAGAEDRAGWLGFGAPPAELGLGLAPFRWIEPKVGRLALFPSTMWHGTAPFPAGERLTVAFDVVPSGG